MTPVIGDDDPRPWFEALAAAWVNKSAELKVNDVEYVTDEVFSALQEHVQLNTASPSYAYAHDFAGMNAQAGDFYRQLDEGKRLISLVMCAELFAGLLRPGSWTQEVRDTADIVLNPPEKLSRDAIAMHDLVRVVADLTARDIPESLRGTRTRIEPVGRPTDDTALLRVTHPHASALLAAADVTIADAFYDLRQPAPTQSEEPSSMSEDALLSELRAGIDLAMRADAALTQCMRTPSQPSLPGTVSSLLAAEGDDRPSATLEAAQLLLLHGKVLSGRERIADRLAHLFGTGILAVAAGDWSATQFCDAAREGFKAATKGPRRDRALTKAIEAFRIRVERDMPPEQQRAEFLSWRREVLSTIPEQLHWLVAETNSPFEDAFRLGLDEGIRSYRKEVGHITVDKAAIALAGLDLRAAAPAELPDLHVDLHRALAAYARLEAAGGLSRLRDVQTELQRQLTERESRKAEAAVLEPAPPTVGTALGGLPRSVRQSLTAGRHHLSHLVRRG